LPIVVEKLFLGNGQKIKILAHCETFFPVNSLKKFDYGPIN
jgi:hypothetical protein